MSDNKLREAAQDLVDYHRSCVEADGVDRFSVLLGPKLTALGKALEPSVPDNDHVPEFARKDGCLSRGMTGDDIRWWHYTDGDGCDRIVGMDLLAYARTLEQRLDSAEKRARSQAEGWTRVLDRLDALESK